MGCGRQVLDMYVCMTVCMYVCMHVRWATKLCTCMYVCMHVCMEYDSQRCLCASTVRAHVCIYAYVCASPWREKAAIPSNMHVCMYTHIFLGKRDTKCLRGVAHAHGSLV